MAVAVAERAVRAAAGVMVGMARLLKVRMMAAALLVALPTLLAQQLLPVMLPLLLLPLPLMLLLLLLPLLLPLPPMPSLLPPPAPRLRALLQALQACAAPPLLPRGGQRCAGL